MSILKAVLAVSVISASSLVMAEGGGDRVYGRMIQDNEKSMREYAVSRGKTPPEVTHYRYGMKLDIAKVVHQTSTGSGFGSSCEVIPAQMTYEDSNGNLQILEYRAMGTACQNQN